MPEQLNQVTIVELGEIHLVGLAVTSVFDHHNPERIEQMKQEFYSRKHEISNVVHPVRYLSPGFTSEVLFTYACCMEVEDLTSIPDGMIGFTVPQHAYAVVQSDTDPYAVIHDYLRGQVMESDNRALALEVYSFANPSWPAEAQVYVPLKSQGLTGLRETSKRVTGIACLNIPVGNIDASVDFYVNRLGCELVRETLCDPAGSWANAFIRFGSDPTALLHQERDSFHMHFLRDGEPAPILELRTEDIRGFYDVLVHTGVPVLGNISETSCGDRFQVSDPDGNRITIVQC